MCICAVYTVYVHEDEALSVSALENVVCILEIIIKFYFALMLAYDPYAVYLI